MKTNPDIDELYADLAKFNFEVKQKAESADLNNCPLSEEEIEELGLRDLLEKWLRKAGGIAKEYMAKDLTISINAWPPTVEVSFTFDTSKLTKTDE